MNQVTIVYGKRRIRCNSIREALNHVYVSLILKRLFILAEQEINSLVDAALFLD